MNILNRILGKKVFPEPGFYQLSCTLFILVSIVGCVINNDNEQNLEMELTQSIRTTEARTPAEEKAGFVLPDGFEIQLFASEPDIGKPLNMAFDAKGRMWLTQSNEYPFPNQNGSDRITILEDSDSDGQADVFTEFADSLNIPIGITPVEDGAIVYSIPNVYHFIDRNQDDQVDERKILLTGFEYKDTHGMINNFVRGLDGWIHADHGYKNSSKVTGTDPSDTLYMTSGNTFRFLPDGSKVELTTTGRVNPFGFAYDTLGYMYGVDCHSSPIYQLIRGGDYPHFGKKPTGIGYAPSMMSHEYGSTALAGLEYYLSSEFPAAFQNNFYYGDVVLSRVLRNSMQFIGTTPIPQQESDFIVSNDPWFRPVDIKLGPDGALYIADFYNRIIGHYEVPLDHPGRDRERGRIWRVTYKGSESDRQDHKDWSTMDLSTLILELSNSNISVRMMVADQLVDRFGTEAVAPVLQIVQSSKSNPLQRSHGLWVLYRLNQLPEKTLLLSLKDPSIQVRVHALRVLFEYNHLAPALLEAVKSVVHDRNPHLKRAAVMVVAKYPDMEIFKELLAQREVANKEDTHLIYAIRQALRDHLRDDNLIKEVSNIQWDKQHFQFLADVLLGVDSETAATLLLEYIDHYHVPATEFINYARHIARYLPINTLNEVITMAQEKAKDDLDLQYSLFTAVQEGVAQRGIPMVRKGIQWAISLAENFLNIELSKWKASTFEELPYNENPWELEKIQLQPPQEMIEMVRSNPDATHTGILFSPVFSLPERLGFNLVGHKRDPLLDEAPTPIRNKVELRLSETDQAIETEYIDSEHVNRLVNWNLKNHMGNEGYLAIIDGSAAKREYIGIGGLDPPLIKIPDDDPSQIAKRQIFSCRIASAYQVTSLVPQIRELLMSGSVDILVRASAAEALLAIDIGSSLSYLESLIKEQNQPQFLLEKLVMSVGEYPTTEANQFLVKMIPVLPYTVQRQVATTLAGTSEGVDLLLEAASAMQLTPRILLDRKIHDMIKPVMSPAQETRFNRITANIKPPEEEVQDLIDLWLSEYNRSEAIVSQGSQVFNSNCVVCHEVKEQGGTIGPQLDGIGSWGARALTEKILDPNRNISQAFINYNIKLKDGSVQSGLFRREEGNLVIFASVNGQEFSISKSLILSKEATPFTLMPDYFSETLTQQDYNALLTYLLSLK